MEEKPEEWYKIASRDPYLFIRCKISRCECNTEDAHCYEDHEKDDREVIALQESSCHIVYLIHVHKRVESIRTEIES